MKVYPLTNEQTEEQLRTEAFGPAREIASRFDFPGTASHWRQAVRRAIAEAYLSGACAASDDPFIEDKLIHVVDGPDRPVRAWKVPRGSFEDKARAYGIESHMIPGLARYVVEHIATGGFWRYVLEGRLEDAERVADEANQGKAAHYYLFLKAFAPLECYGSPSRVAAWINARP